MIIHEKDNLKKVASVSEAIIMLPFAGGNSYSYKQILKFFPPGITVICPELPGRGLLPDEPFITNMEHLAAYVFQNYIRHLNQSCRYLIYGHSMGALLGYLLTHKIYSEGMKLPGQLIVSGRKGPGFEGKNELTHTLPSDLFRQKIGLMGGTSNEVLADEELMAYFEPILRSDIKAVETYAHFQRNPLNIPIGVLYGSEEHMPEEAIACWQYETTEPIEVIKMEGKHFFIFEHQKLIADYLIKKLLSLRTFSF